MIPDCQQRLEAAVHDLQSLVVRHPSHPPTHRNRITHHRLTRVVRSVPWYRPPPPSRLSGLGEGERGDQGHGRAQARDGGPGHVKHEDPFRHFVR